MAGEALVDAAGVDEHDGAEGAGAEVVPHEAEALLAGRAEQVHDERLVDGDAAEVHGDGGGGLLADVGDVVDAGGHRGHGGLGAQRLDLGDGADEGRLADAEAAGDDELDGDDPGVGSLGFGGVHDVPPAGSGSDGAHALDHLGEHVELDLDGVGVVDVEQPGGDEVAGDDGDDTEDELELDRHLGDGQRLVAARPAGAPPARTAGPAGMSATDAWSIVSIRRSRRSARVRPPVMMNGRTKS